MRPAASLPGDARKIPALLRPKEKRAVLRAFFMRRARKERLSHWPKPKNPAHRWAGSCWGNDRTKVET
jgi:hypothetical protein